MFSPTTNPPVDMITDHTTKIRSCPPPPPPPPPPLPPPPHTHSPTQTHTLRHWMFLHVYINIYRVASCKFTPFAFKRAMYAQINLHVAAVWAVHSCALLCISLVSMDSDWSLRLYELVWVGATKRGFSRRASVTIWRHCLWHFYWTSHMLSANSLGPLLDLQ